MSDWELIKSAFRWQDKRQIQRDCLAFAGMLFVLLVWALFTFALDQ